MIAHQGFVGPCACLGHEHKWVVVGGQATDAHELVQCS